MEARFQQYTQFRWMPFLAAIASIVFANIVIDRYLHGHPNSIVAKTDDLRGYQSAMLLAPADTGAISVYFFGGSGMMWTLLTDKDMGEYIGNSVNSHNFAYGYQTLIESYTLIKQLPVKAGTTIFLHVSTSRLNRVNVSDQLLCRPYLYTLDNRRLFDSYEELSLKPKKTNALCQLSVVTHADIAKRVFLSEMRNGRVAYISHIPQAFELDAEKLEKQRQDKLLDETVTRRDEFAARWLALDEESLQVSMRILKKIKDYLQQKGARLVVIDTPLNKEWFDRYLHWTPANEARYLEFTRNLKEEGFEYYDLRWDQRFNYDDFYDHQHVIQSGRLKMAAIYKEILNLQK